MTTIPDPVELTQALIRMDTVNPPGNEEPAALYIGDLMTGAGLQVSYHRLGKNRLGLVAVAPGRVPGPPLVFTGHLDTVTPGQAPWTFLPLSGELRDGRLMGRGSSDMKGGVGAMVVTALGLAADGEERRDVVFIFTAGEETGCSGALQMREEGILPPQAGALIVAEPTGNLPVLGHKGVLWLECTARGRAAHGSMPHLGENAIYRAARAAAGLEDLFSSAPAHPRLGKPTVNVGTFTGGSKINMVPDRALFTVDLRTVPGMDHGRLFQEVGSHMGTDISIERLIDLPGILTPSDHPWIRRVFDIIERLQRERSEPGYVTYFTDASVLAPAMDNPQTLILGPGEPSQAHQTDEFCVAEKITLASDVYLEIARNWCGS
ncbi:MAG: M20 family metallopeptidase [Deltaproteobacteria bacterium]|nr:M20 family metallopeptidase [Deltaproteobacteria bacterium]MBW2050004.1 M20 family metallopeptidase [Deltaproteobacteria bacterium]MBW2354636.1 M20 family metallopeptidase [Deltaproteobacteria bacterium]